MKSVSLFAAMFLVGVDMGQLQQLVAAGIMCCLLAVLILERAKA